MEDTTDPEASTLATSSAVTTVSFENDILPILTARCAFAGCHVEDDDNDDRDDEDDDEDDREDHEDEDDHDDHD